MRRAAIAVLSLVLAAGAAACQAQSVAGRAATGKGEPMTAQVRRDGGQVWIVEDGLNPRFAKRSRAAYPAMVARYCGNAMPYPVSPESD